MTVSLTQPGEGTVGWSTGVNNNFATIEAALNALNVAVVVHEVASGSGGGSTTSGDWYTRPLSNTPASDPGGLVSVSSNQITLVAGTYLVRAFSSFFCQNGDQVSCRTRLQNVTDSSTAAISVNSRGHIATGESLEVLSVLEGLIQIASSKTFELQYRVQTGVATYGLGYPMSLGINERYAQVTFLKLA